MRSKFTVEVVFQTESEDRDMAAQAICEALAPLASHPLIMVRVSAPEPAQRDIQQQLSEDAATQAQNLQAERNDAASSVFERIMAAPDV